MTFDPSPYVEGLKRANEAERRAIDERTLRARDEARLLARRIGESDTAVRRIYLFGSLATGGPNRLDFDIDLACDGGDVYLAMEIAEGSEFSVDIVDLHLLPGHVRTQIERDAVLLFYR